MTFGSKERVHVTESLGDFTVVQPSYLGETMTLTRADLSRLVTAGVQALEASYEAEHGESFPPAAQEKLRWARAFLGAVFE